MVTEHNTEVISFSPVFSASSDDAK